MLSFCGVLMLSTVAVQPSGLGEVSLVLGTGVFSYTWYRCAQ